MITKKKLLTATPALVGVMMLSASMAAGDSVTLPFSGGGNTVNGCYSSLGVRHRDGPAQTPWC